MLMSLFDIKNTLFVTSIDVKPYQKSSTHQNTGPWAACENFLPKTKTF